MLNDGVSGGSYFGLGDGNLAYDVEPVVEDGAVKVGIISGHGSIEVPETDVFLGQDKLFSGRLADVDLINLLLKDVQPIPF